REEREEREERETARAFSRLEGRNVRAMDWVPNDGVFFRFSFYKHCSRVTGSSSHVGTHSHVTGKTHGCRGWKKGHARSNSSSVCDALMGNFIWKQDSGEDGISLSSLSRNHY
ncbi:hypothetical protein, partial [Akkermansia sp. KLE1797]